MRRLRLGIFGTVAAFATAFALTILNAPPALRAIVFLPLVLASFGFYQYHARTCVRLAATGRRNLDSGSERVTDNAELAAMRAQARRVQVQAVSTALAITALYFALG